MTAKPLVNLWGINGIGLILLYPSGVMYSNQVAGYTIMHPQEEGIFVPLHWADLEPALEDMYVKLDEHFVTGPKYGGHCGYGIDNETADFLDALFQTVSTTRHLRVDRARLKNCVEAWIYVRIILPEKPDPELSMLFTGALPETGVLTWVNSD